MGKPDLGKRRKRRKGDGDNREEGGGERRSQLLSPLLPLQGAMPPFSGLFSWACISVCPGSSLFQAVHSLTLTPSTGHLPRALITLWCLWPRLSNNPLTAAGVALLVEGLAGNTSLTHLSLLHTGLGDEGLELLAAQLDRNQQLQELNVAYNGAGDTAALALATAAREHPSLELLQ